MQMKLERRRAASNARNIRRFAFLAGVPLIAASALAAPGPAFSACGASHPAGVHSAAVTGVHTAASRPSTGGSGEGGTLGCANGASAPAAHGLSIASSGRVIDGGAHPAARTATHARTAATKPANAAAHPRGAKPHHA